VGRFTHAEDILRRGSFLCTYESSHAPHLKQWTMALATWWARCNVVDCRERLRPVSHHPGNSPPVPLQDSRTPPFGDFHEAPLSRGIRFPGEVNSLHISTKLAVSEVNENRTEPESPTPDTPPGSSCLWCAPGCPLAVWSRILYEISALGIDHCPRPSQVGQRRRRLHENCVDVSLPEKCWLV